MSLFKRFRSTISSLNSTVTSSDYLKRYDINPECELMLLGRLLSEQVKAKKDIDSLSEVEFKVFSQFGDDGIIQWLVNNLEIEHKTFIEFGVEDYLESNTRFLMMNDNWSGFVMDGGDENIRIIRNSEYFWRHELIAECAFIDKENINEYLAKIPFNSETGLLHIDLDGNDYWIWREIDNISPVVLILEYNSAFGIDRPITVPYDKNFYRTDAHFSNLYFGASLTALYRLSREKGYAFIGCNSAGNNAYFVRNDKINEIVKEVPLEKGFVVSKFRESRDIEGRLTFLSGNERLSAIKGLPVYNMDSHQLEKL